MRVCQACGEENPDRARLCMMCGVALADVATPAREERKVVSVLFCDLVGFTSRSESMDVEDVRGTLQPYHALLRRELERFGGTVEKFIGDAVMAVFGAPVAHEDDPERAVRSALAIVDAVAELCETDARLDLHLRVGVNTGEALVALDADPGRGEGMASGDVVNTAARLESAAPVDCVLVGEVTYRATSRAIRYEPVGAVTAKGKSEPVAAWRAVEARSRFGVDVAQGSGAEMVGREREFDVLRAAAERAFVAHEVQLVTLVGVPGIGKSRLVWELGRWVDGLPDLVHWRQGRCLPYGDGVTWWALGEILKAEAGILESDSAQVAAQKLDVAIGAAVPDAQEAAWVGRHARGIVGITPDGGGGGDGGGRDEAFSAWRRLFEALAASGPMVVVFEDVHWADEAMLDFVDHLVEWAGEVPLLIVCSARPELLERRRDWGGGKPNAATIALRPLTDADTRSLVATLLEQTVMSDQTRDALLERAAGNPLYAEEYVRMLHDRGSLGAVGEEVLPESVQGIIAARLDALPADEKQLLQDAAVLGKVLWLAALEAVGGADRSSLEERLHRLTRKEFIRRAQRSSVEGEVEYAFRHVLVQDVAYHQIPRAQRSHKHRLAAGWIAGLSQDRDDAVEMRAHHLARALEYAHAGGQDTAALATETRLALRAAGDRAVRLDAYAAAASHYQAAVDLTSNDDPDLGYLALDLGRSLGRAGAPCEQELVRAIDLLHLRDPAAAAVAHSALAGERSARGDGDGRRHHTERALELIADAPASRHRARVLFNAAMSAVVESRNTDAVALLDEYLSIAAAVGLDAQDVMAASAYRGTARVWTGQVDGLDEEAQAVSDLRRSGDFQLGILLNNLATDHLCLGAVDRYRELMLEAVEWIQIHTPWRVGGVIAEVAFAAYLGGDWDEAITRVVVCEERANSEQFDQGQASFWLGTRARIMARRGMISDAVEVEARALALAREGGRPDALGPELAESAWLELVVGSGVAAAAHLDELLGLVADPSVLLSALPYLGAELAEVAQRLGRTTHLRSLVDAIPLATPWTDALLASLADDHMHAAELYTEIGSRIDAAFAHLRAAEALTAPGRPDDARPHLEYAVEFYGSVGATLYLERAAPMLAQADP